MALPVLAASLLVLAGLTGCERPRDVAVRVSIPGPDSVETPVTGVGCCTPEGVNYYCGEGAIATDDCGA